MLKVRLMGGLGNQMFQYAFARSFQLRNQINVALDLTFLNDKRPRPHFTLRDYELDIFPIALKTTALPPHTLYSLPYKLVNKLSYKLFPEKSIIEHGMRFQESFLTKKEATVAIGFFQTEKYFKQFRKQILTDFDFEKSINPINKQWAETIKSGKSISIHVRRGDYVTSKASQQTLGICSLDYYQKAINFFEQNFPLASFYIFSDEIEWAQKNLKFKLNTHFLDHNKGKDSYQDLYLMSLCHHNIIANSSFSWWGAWLNQNPEKTVVSPHLWFSDPNMDASDIYCDGWLRF